MIDYKIPPKYNIIFRETFDAPLKLTGIPTTGWNKNWQEHNSISGYQPNATLTISGGNGRFSLKKPVDPYRTGLGIRSEALWNDVRNYPKIGFNYLSYTVMLPSSHYSRPEPAPEIVGFNIHDAPLPYGTSSNWTNPMGFWIQNNRWVIKIVYSLQDVQKYPGSLVSKMYDCGPIELDKFTKWEVDRNWSNGPDAYCRVYKNGVLVVDHVGPNWYAGSFSPEPYVKVGIYKWPWAKNWDPAWGASYATERVAIYSEVVFGKSYREEPNVAPTVSIAEVPTLRKVTIRATASDSDGTIASYLWDNGATTPETSYEGAIGSTKMVTVVVTDNDGAKTTKTHYITF